MRIGSIGLSLFLVAPPHFALGTFPNDPQYSAQWHLPRVGAPAAWAVTLGSTQVLVAVLDTGTTYAHADAPLHFRTDIDYDFVNDDDNATDDHGHGTHVTGIIAAAIDNAVGIASLAPGVSIVAYKVLDATGNGSFGNISAAVEEAAVRGAQIICMPIGGNEDDATLAAAIASAAAAGSLVIAAAGDESSEISFPARLPEVVAVGATNALDARAHFSNYGPQLDLVAPGTSIRSTYGSSYADLSSTAMATAIACAAAALVYTVSPCQTTPADVRAVLGSSAEDLGDPGWDWHFGDGLIRADLAVASPPHGGGFCDVVFRDNLELGTTRRWSLILGEP